MAVMGARGIAVGCLTLVGCAAPQGDASAPAAPAPVPSAPVDTRSDRQRCDAGDAESCYFIGFEIVTDAELDDGGDPDVLDRAHERARPHFEKACALHHALACGELGRQIPRCLRLLPGMRCDTPEAQERWLKRSVLMEKACDEGDPLACVEIGEERIEDRQPAKARGYLRLACDSGDLAAARACELLR